MKNTGPTSQWRGDIENTQNGSLQSMQQELPREGEHSTMFSLGHPCHTLVLV